MHLRPSHREDGEFRPRQRLLLTHRLLLHAGPSLLSLIPLQFAPIATYPIGGLLSQSPLGWHSVHYVIAALALALFIGLLLYYRKKTLQRLFRQHELARVCLSSFPTPQIFMGGTSKEAKAVITMKDVPYLTLYQDPHVWGVFVGGFGYFSAMQLSVQYGPVFIHRVCLLLR